MRLTIILICALVCLFVISVKGDDNQLTTNDTSTTNGQAINSSEESDSLSEELAQWYGNQKLNFAK